MFFFVEKYRIPNRFLNKGVKNSITESLSGSLLSKILFQLQWINSKQKISSILQGNYIQSNMFYGAFPGHMEIGSHNTESDDRLIQVQLILNALWIKLKWRWSLKQVRMYMYI